MTSPNAAKSSCPSRSAAASTYRMRLCWTAAVFACGYMMGTSRTSGSTFNLLVSTEKGSEAVNNHGGADSTSRNLLCATPTTGGTNSKNHSKNDGFRGNDLLPHLKNCNKPQSSRTLKEMAAHYKPSKFYRYVHTNFDRFYPQYLEKYRGKEFRMLEIGLDTGFGSLLWEEYFPCATLVGLEYNVDNTKNEGASSIQSIVGDQGDAEFLKTSFLEQSNGGHFDLIIDDGGHHYEQQRVSYEVLFEKALNPGGLYIMEDIETSYWKEGSDLYGKTVTRGGLKAETIVNHFKDVVDVINKKFHDNTYTVFGQVDHLISLIGFGSNVIFLEKKTQEHCINERPYVWPKTLAGPARTQPLDANKGSLIEKFCEGSGVDLYVRDRKKD